MTDLRKLGEGREAEIFEWGDGQVVRLLRDPGNVNRLAVEAAAMRAAAERGVPLPAIGELVTVDGRPGMVMGRIDGPDMITSMARRPWTVPRGATLLGTLQAELHEVRAPVEVPALRATVRDRIHRGTEPPFDLPPRLARHALALLEQLPEGDTLCHGDFHPGNVLLGRNGPVVIDWVNTMRGDPAADVARTRLMLQVASLPPGSPALLRTFDRLGRAAFRQQWWRAYRRRHPLDPGLVDRWQVVRAADRLVEGIAEEVSALLELIDRDASATS